MIPQIIFSILLSIAIFLLAFNLELEKMGLASNLSALLIVLGGTLAATLIAYPWRRLIWTAHLLKKSFLSVNEIDWTQKTIVTLARAYRKDGIRVLERMGEKLPDGHLKTAVELISYNYTKNEIEHILQKEAHIIYNQYEASRQDHLQHGKTCPRTGIDRNDRQPHSHIRAHHGYQWSGRIYGDCAVEHLLRCRLCQPLLYALCPTNSGSLWIRKQPDSN